MNELNYTFFFFYQKVDENFYWDRIWIESNDSLASYI